MYPVVISGLVLIVSLCAVGLLLRLFRRAQTAGPSMSAHYVRLGQLAPGDRCYCGRDGSYGSCCRARDVESLRAEVISYLLQRWGRRSYLGRRQNYSMRSRLQDHPLPPVCLPEWVSEPCRFTFPIADDVLRAWRPNSKTAAQALEESPDHSGELF